MDELQRACCECAGAETRAADALRVAREAADAADAAMPALQQRVAETAQQVTGSSVADDDAALLQRMQEAAAARRAGNAACHARADERARAEALLNECVARSAAARAALDSATRAEQQQQQQRRLLLLQQRREEVVTPLGKFVDEVHRQCFSAAREAAEPTVRVTVHSAQHRFALRLTLDTSKAQRDDESGSLLRVTHAEVLHDEGYGDDVLRAAGLVLEEMPRGVQMFFARLAAALVSVAPVCSAEDMRDALYLSACDPPPPNTSRHRRRAAAAAAPATATSSGHSPTRRRARKRPAAVAAESPVHGDSAATAAAAATPLPLPLPPPPPSPENSEILQKLHEILQKLQEMWLELRVMKDAMRRSEVVQRRAADIVPPPNTVDPRVFAHARIRRPWGRASYEMDEYDDDDNERL